MLLPSEINVHIIRKAGISICKMPFFMRSDVASFTSPFFQYLFLPIQNLMKKETKPVLPRKKTSIGAKENHSGFQR